MVLRVSKVILWVPTCMVMRAYWRRGVYFKHAVEQQKLVSLKAVCVQIKE